MKKQYILVVLVLAGLTLELQLQTSRKITPQKKVHKSLKVDDRSSLNMKLKKKQEGPEGPEGPGGPEGQRMPALKYMPNVVRAPSALVHMAQQIPGDSNITLIGCQMQEVGLCQYSITYDKYHQRVADPKCQEFFDKYVNFIDKYKDFHPLVDIYYKKIYQKKDRKLVKVRFNLEVPDYYNNKAIIYMSNDMEHKNFLCHGLKRVAKVEFDESGNPKEAEGGDIGPLGQIPLNKQSLKQNQSGGPAGQEPGPTPQEQEAPQETGAAAPDALKRMNKLQTDIKNKKQQQHPKRRLKAKKHV